MQVQEVGAHSRQRRVVQRPDQAGHLPGDVAAFGLALLGECLPPRRSERVELAPGDLGVVAPVQRPDSPAALAAMVQAGHLPAQLL